MLDLTVIVSYYGPKAGLFYPDSTAGIKLLKDDLIKLKLPHPKMENISIAKLPDGGGQCTFTWPHVIPNCTLHKQLRTRINGAEDEKQELLEALSINRLELFENPSKRSSTSSTFHHKQWHRPNPDPGLRTEAQMLLDDMASALKIPKTEPIEPILSNIFQSSSAIAPPQPPTDSYWQNRFFDPTIDCDSSMSISSSRPTSPQQPPILSQDSEPSVQQDPFLAAPSIDLGSTPTPPGFTMSNQYQKEHLFAHSRQTSSSTRFPRKRSHSPDHLRRQPPPHFTRFSPAKNSNTPLPASSSVPSPKVAELTRELWNVRRQTTACVAREKAIITELRTLSPKVSLDTSQEREEAAIRTRLREVEAELAQEKKLRMETEAVLADVQKECKAPFVVPAMFSAFRMLSEITTQVMEKPA